MFFSLASYSCTLCSADSALHRAVTTCHIVDTWDLSYVLDVYMSSVVSPRSLQQCCMGFRQCSSTRTSCFRNRGLSPSHLFTINSEYCETADNTSSIYQAAPPEACNRNPSWGAKHIFSIFQQVSQHAMYIERSLEWLSNCVAPIARREATNTAGPCRAVYQRLKYTREMPPLAAFVPCLQNGNKIWHTYYAALLMKGIIDRR